MSTKIPLLRNVDAKLIAIGFISSFTYIIDILGLLNSMQKEF